jgi:hypothetical protein
MKMRDAVNMGDAASLRLTAHSLKSNGVDMGALTFADLCKQLEMLGRDGAVSGASELLAQTEAEFQSVQSALITFRDS